jgi:hypothetical protein
MVAFFLEDLYIRFGVLCIQREYICSNYYDNRKYDNSILKHHHPTLLWPLALRQEHRLSLKQNAKKNI